MVVKAYILLTVTSGFEREVCSKLLSYDEVTELNELYGEYDIIVGVQVDTLDDLDNFLTNKVRSIPNILLTYTMIVARKCKGDI